ncbi:hypothetical protein Q7P37_011466 [Cladosporium fusiforme]
MAPLLHTPHTIKIATHLSKSTLQKNTARVQQRPYSELVQRRDNWCRLCLQELQRPLLPVHAPVAEAASTTTAIASPLLRLPLELRQRIFALAVVKDNPIDLQFYSTQRIGENNRRLEVGPDQCHHDSTHRLRVVQRQRRGESRICDPYEYVPSTPGHTALLQVCKQIHLDATPILYGSNKFMLRDIITLGESLKQIATSKRYLRNIGIGIGGYIPIFPIRDKKNVFLKLARTARDLRSLSISHYELCAPPRCPHHATTIKDFVDHVKPLLESLQASYTAQNLELTAFDVIKLEPLSRCVAQPAHEHGRLQHHVVVTRNGGEKSRGNGTQQPCYCLCGEERAIHSRMEQDLKEEIAKQLNLALE